VVGAGHVLSAKEHPDGTRTRLKVAVSSDRGRTWRTIAELEDAVTLGKHIPMFQAPTMVSLLRSAPPPRRVAPPPPPPLPPAPCRAHLTRTYT
jgi:hypothetical protein